MTNLTTAATAIGDTVSTSAVPCHTDEETTVVTEVSGPPILGVGHDGRNVLLESSIVKALEGLGVVEVLAERIGGRVVLTEDVQAELLWPPVTVAGAAAANVHGTVHGALALSHLGWCL